MIKKIPFAEPWFSESYADIVRDQILSRVIDSGLTTAAFQEALAIRVKARHCLLTTSGTVALSVCAIALGLKPGDEVLVPAYGSISSVNAFASIGLSVRLADIQPRSGCLSSRELAKRLTPRTRAVCFVDFAGYVGRNILEVREFCDGRGLSLIEDASKAFRQEYRETFAGTFAHMGIYSFGSSEIITTGQGGAIVTDSEEYYRRALNYIHQGDFELKKTGVAGSVGTNLRFNDILAAFGLGQLRDVDARLMRKLNAYEVLRRRLAKKIFEVPGAFAPQFNIVFAQEPLKLIAALKEQGVYAVQLYRKITDHPAYRSLGTEGFPGADYWNEKAVYLPCGLNLSFEDADRIAEAVLDSGCTLESLPE